MANQSTFLSRTLLQTTRIASYAHQVVFFVAFTFVVVMHNGCGEGVLVSDPLPTVYDAELFDSDDFVFEWCKLTNVVIQKTPQCPAPVAARTHAYVALALHEALVNGMPKSQSLQVQLNGLSELPSIDTNKKRYHWLICANAAMADVLRSLMAGAPATVLASIDTLEKKNYEQRKEAVQEDFMIDRSVAYGKELAQAILRYAQADGGDNALARLHPQDYTVPTTPGAWVPTSTQTIPLLPTWGNNRPFFLTMNDAGLDPGDYTAFSTDRTSEFYSQARSLSQRVRDILPEKVSLIRYWENPTSQTATLPGHVISLMVQILEQSPKKVDKCAELYARLAMTMNDAYIATWNAKYKRNLMRPQSYIRLYIDRSWGNNAALLPIPTPDSPEYVSNDVVVAYSTIPIFQQVLQSIPAFIDRTHSKRGLPEREYSSINTIIDEIEETQTISGIHYTFSISAGKNIGTTIFQKQQRLLFR